MDSKKACYAIESICFEIAKLDASKQAMFIERLQGVLTEKELTALQIGIAYFRLLIHDDLRNAMKAMLAQELYSEFRKQIES